MTSLLSAPTTLMANNLRRVIAERNLQDIRWGVQDHDPAVWHLIISEELGELAEAILDDRAGITRDSARMREEATQVAASAVAFLEYLDRKEGGE